MMISRSTEPRNTSGGGEAVGRLSDAGLVDAHSVAGDARTEHAVGEDGLTSDSSRSGATGSKAGAGASSGAASVAGVAAGAIVCASAAHAVLVARARVARARAEIEWTMVTARLGVGHGELGGAHERGPARRSRTNAACHAGRDSRRQAGPGAAPPAARASRSRRMSKAVRLPRPRALAACPRATRTGLPRLYHTHAAPRPPAGL